MFKNVIIGILAVAVIGFSYIAIKNSKPIECDNVVYTAERKSLCVIELDAELTAEQIHEALQLEYGKQAIF